MSGSRLTSAAGMYVAGLGVVALATVGLGLVLDGEARRGLWLAAVLGLLVQAPLGWWLVRSIGQPQFLRVWAIGMASRLSLLALMAFVVLPVLGWPLGPGLISLAAVLVVLLALETIAAAGRASRKEAQ